MPLRPLARKFMGASKQAPGNVEIRSELRPGDLGTIVLMHGVLYAREYQMDHTFEGHVAAGLGEFAKGYDAQKDRIWLAETEGRMVGSIAISGRENQTGQLRWFLLEPEVRGLGLGKRLVREAVEFCRQCTYRNLNNLMRKSPQLCAPRTLAYLFTLYVCLGAVLSCSAQDWFQWRGPSRDAKVPVASAPGSWPESLNREWRVELGEGYSSPVVAGDKVFVHSRRDPHELVTAIRLAKGEIAWQQKYSAPFKKNEYAVKMAKGPNATPLVLDKRLFTLGVSGILNVWDTASGKLLWTKDFSQSIDTSKLFCGTAASPLANDGLVVIQVGSDIHGGRILALEPESGDTKWEWSGPGPGYASPIVIDAGGLAQIVTLTNSSIIGLDAKTGRQLWTTPFPDEWHENIATPLWTGSHLIVSGTRQGTHAYLIERDGGQWQAKEVWKNPNVAMYMSSPVYGDGLIFGHSAKRKGQFVALDAATGKIRWATEGREGDHASTLLTPDHLIYLTNGADLIVAKRDGKEFTIVKRYDVAEAETWAMPVLLGSHLIIRDATGLIRYSVGAASSKEPIISGELGSMNNPVRCSGPRGQRAYLNRLRCPDGTAPQYYRIGSFGLGPYGKIIDGYGVKCEGKDPVRIFMDMYHDHVEDTPVPGFTIASTTRRAVARRLP